MRPPIEDRGLRRGFGERVRLLRKKRGWTQKELAARLGVKTPQLTKYEAGLNTPSFEKLVDLADLLEVTLDFLIVGDRPEEKTLTNLLLLDRLVRLEAISKDDQETVIKLIDAVLLKSSVTGSLIAEKRPRRRGGEPASPRKVG